MARFMLHSVETAANVVLNEACVSLCPCYWNFGDLGALA